MQILKCNKQPRKTKRQLKLINGANTMVKHSIENGVEILQYLGKTPVFLNKAPSGQIENYIKVTPGVPFVNKSNFGL